MKRSRSGMPAGRGRGKRAARVPAKVADSLSQGVLRPPIPPYMSPRVVAGKDFRSGLNDSQQA